MQPQALSRHVQPTAVDTLDTAIRVVLQASAEDRRPVLQAITRKIRMAIMLQHLPATAAFPLRQVARKHLQETWTDSVLDALARSREDADKVLLRALPTKLDLFALDGMAGAIARVEQAVGPRTETGSAILSHAKRLIEELSVIAQALETLKELESDAHRDSPAGSGLPTFKPDQRPQAAERALTRGLRPWADATARAILEQGVAVPETEDFARTTTCLASPGMRDLHRFGRRAQMMRQTLRAALVEDVLAEMVPPIRRLLRRNPGLLPATAFVTTSPARIGTVKLELAHRNFRIDAVTTVDLDLGTIVSAYKAPRDVDGLATFEEDQVEAMITVSSPAEHDDRQRRALRRIIDLDPLARMDVQSPANDTTRLLVHVADGPRDTEMFERIVTIGAEENVDIVVPVRPKDKGIASLAELGFVWMDGGQGCWLIAPATGCPAYSSPGFSNA